MDEIDILLLDKVEDSEVILPRASAQVVQDFIAHSYDALSILVL